MRYLDTSESTAQDLKTVGATGDRMHLKNRLVDVAVESGDGNGLSATNLGLNAYEVVVGFSDGPRVNESDRFSTIAIKELGQQWQVRIVPAGSGALPDEHCTENASVVVAPPNTSFERSRGE